MSRIAAIILAAGQGIRFGASNDDSKVLAELYGKPLVARVAETALASRASPVVVVTGHSERKVAAALAGLSVEIVCHSNYRAGMAGSLKAGLAVLPADADGALILLADMPFVKAATLDSLIATCEAQRDGFDAIVPYFGEKPGNPVLISRRLFGDVLQLTGDRGARALVFEPGRVVVPHSVDDPAIHVDIDTLATYQSLGGHTQA